jgi:hypothetical protein
MFDNVLCLLQPYMQESYLRAMIQAYDHNRCTIQGCDQGQHNILVHMGHLLPNSTMLQPSTTKEHARIKQVEIQLQGKGVVNTVAVLCKKGRSELPTQNDGVNSTLILNLDGHTSPVVHQYDRCPKIKEYVAQKADEMLKLWQQTKQKKDVYPVS